MDSQHQIHTRMGWIKIYQSCGSISVAARRCGIGRSTLHRWVNRYRIDPRPESLIERSRRPHRLARLKVTDEDEQLIYQVRVQRRYGKLRIACYLLQYHGLKLSPATIGRVLRRLPLPPLKRFRKPKAFKRYARPIPGDRIQMDVCKIMNGMYQYTAIDDCSRYKVVKLYSRRTAANSVDFLKYAISKMPFPFQRIQTDRGQEFFAYLFQDWLHDHHIKFRPIKPRSPHLNGKVERTQQTDLQEFYALQNLKDPSLSQLLAEWQTFYNFQRPHSSLKGKTPADIVYELLPLTPTWEEVFLRFDPAKEHIRDQSYYWDVQWAKQRKQQNS
ncbi:IS481 family transposase [Larkinella soli]|uniref:IS481 family transposase n=1 Tax=Larkinella soli TaxID=1770527 RepID=UPI000FFC9F0E|nr:IS481 family transposase [Larkinella soli]